MKTVGEILSRTRRQKGFSLNDLSQRTKIDPRHIQALENNDFQKLPPTTFIKGFIRNLALALDKNPQELIAIFRRDYQDNHSSKRSPKNIFANLNRSIFFHSRLPLIITAVLLFFSYLAFQYRAILIPPKLEVAQPQDNQVIASPIIIEGLSTVDSVITINDQQEINTDQDGHFLTQLELPTGAIKIKITATNRFGRTSTRTIPITIVSQ